MNYAEIKKFDIANGPGIRISLFVSGCRHRCKNCFNSLAWDFNYGAPFTKSTAREILELAAPSYVEGLSILGGEPFEPENRGQLIDLLKDFKKLYPQKNVWCYTGFVLDKELIFENSSVKSDVLDLLSLIDVLVDGRFEESLKSPALLFRGSSNQRIIDVRQTLKEGHTVLLKGKWERQMGSTNIDEL